MMDIFTQDQLDEIVDQLLAATTNGKLVWEAGADAEYSFYAFPDSLGFGVSSKDKDDMAPHVLRILDYGSDEPKVLQVIDTTYSSSDLSSAVSDLYLLVKRRTLNVEESADRVFEVLKRLNSDPE